MLTHLWGGGRGCFILSGGRPTASNFENPWSRLTSYVKCLEVTYAVNWRLINKSDLTALMLLDVLLLSFTDV